MRKFKVFYVAPPHVWNRGGRADFIFYEYMNNMLDNGKIKKTPDRLRSRVFVIKGKYWRRKNIRNHKKNVKNRCRK